MLSGKVVDRTFNAGVRVETASVDKREMQYLYADGDDYVFMDTASFDQLQVPVATVGEARHFMLEGQTAVVATHDGRVPLYVELPAAVELMITYTEPGMQGDRSTGGTKPATLETGYEIHVPLFITQDEKVKVDTRDGSLPRARLTPSGSPHTRHASARSTSSSRPTSVVSRSTWCSRAAQIVGKAPATPIRETLVLGVVEHADEIDALIEANAIDWSLDRMPAVDRALLRLATYELRWGPEVAPAVAIDEAVELAKELSTDESPCVRQRGAGAHRHSVTPSEGAPGGTRTLMPFGNGF